MTLAFRETRGSVRQGFLTALTGEHEQEDRATRIAIFRAESIDGVKQRRQWVAEQHRHKKEKLAKHEEERLYLHSEITNIRNASHKRALQRLLSYSYHRSNDKNLTQVDYSIIEGNFGKDIADALAHGLKAIWSAATVPMRTDYPNGEIPWDVHFALAGLHTRLEEGCDISALTDPDAGRAAQLAAWELNKPPSWFEGLVHAKEDAVYGALHPWILSEAVVLADTYRYGGALGLSLNCSPAVRALLMKPLLPLVVEGRIGHPETLKAVVEALLEDGQVAPSLASEIFREKATASTGPEGVLGEDQWLYLWMQENSTEAFAWFESHLASHPTKAREQVKMFAKAAADCKWVKLPADEASIDVLLRLHELLTRYLPTSSASDDEGSPGAFHPINRMRETALELLVQSRGIPAHRALVHLADKADDPSAKSWYLSRVQEHAGLETLLSANVEPDSLTSIGLPFLTEPKTEAQLFEQVVARLEDIRTRIEEGPFSERDLFSSGMPEKHLQHWLAAHFCDTPNRRFSIHREEEVDDDKKTDIQLSARVGSVCVEIKPIDRGRYSANSLVGTLRDQIVGQYLKGENSQHGILLLFQLDTKNWDIPDGPKAQPFPVLVEYLQRQADRIKAESGIQQLLVFGINCVL
jgi:hypothetical protein